MEKTRPRARHDGDRDGRLLALVAHLLPSASKDVGIAWDLDEDVDEGMEASLREEKREASLFVRTVDVAYVRMVHASARYVSRASSYDVLAANGAAAIKDEDPATLARLLRGWYAHIVATAAAAAGTTSPDPVMPLRSTTAFARFMPLFHETALACGATVREEDAVAVADKRLRDMGLVLLATAVVPVCARADRLSAYVFTGVDAIATHATPLGVTIASPRHVVHYLRVHVVPTLHALAGVCDMVTTWAAAAADTEQRGPPGMVDTCAACYRTLVVHAIELLKLVESESWRNALRAAILQSTPALPMASTDVLRALQVSAAGPVEPMALPTATQMAMRQPLFYFAQDARETTTTKEEETEDGEEEEEEDEDDEGTNEPPTKRRRLITEIHARLRALLARD